MASPEYSFLNSSGGAICPTSDGEYLTIDMSSGPNREAELTSITFFSDQLGQNVVTPTAGTVKLMGSPDGVTWLDVAFGTFSASSVNSGSRVMPHAIGDMRFAKIILSGVSGASHFSASLWRS